MIQIGNTPVLTTIYQIMVVLQRELKIDGSHYLREVKPQKYQGQDIQFTCPFHKNGLESKPSCGITSIGHKRDGAEIPAGTFNCFTCHAHGDITELISHCFGKKDGGLFGKKWILDHFSNYEVENREGFFKLMGQKEISHDTSNYVTEEELQKYRYYHPYQKKRYLTDELIDVFDIGYDSSFKLRDDLYPFGCITFPVKDENGNVVFIARRSVKGKIFHYPPKVDKPLYGLWEVKHLFPTHKTLYICESILNSLMFVKWGKSAIALLGTGAHNQIEMLKHLDYRSYILCLDNDEAGQKGTEKLCKALSKYKLINKLEVKQSGKDVNDYGYCKTYEEFLNEQEKGEM